MKRNAYTGYVPPTTDELQILMRFFRCDVEDIADDCGVHLRSAYKWVDGERAMPFTALFTVTSMKAEIRLRPRTWRDTLFGDT